MHIKFNSWINVLCMACTHAYRIQRQKNRWWWYRHTSNHVRSWFKRGIQLFLFAHRSLLVAILNLLHSAHSFSSVFLFYPISHSRTIALYILTPHSLKNLRKILYKMNNWFSIVRKWWKNSTTLDWHWYWLKIEWTIPMKLSTLPNIPQRKFICLNFAWW